jgi:hypothetical protein
VQRFGKPIVRTGKPTVYAKCDLATRKETASNETKVRVLRPDEYEALRLASAKPDHMVQMDLLLLGGFRYIEARRFHDNPDWFDGNFVFLPRGAMLKAKALQAERNVRLSRLGKEIVPLFSKVKNLPTPETWRENLERWAAKAGLDPVGLGPKTTRKTWESWLMFTYSQNPTAWLTITQSQGHTADTSLHHYLNMPFLQADLERMRPWVEGYF